MFCVFIGTKWFSGKILRVNRDGTFDIRYDDGDSESGALKLNIRKHPDSMSASSRYGSSETTDFIEGDKVECLYKGKGLFVCIIMNKLIFLTFFDNLNYLRSRDEVVLGENLSGQS